MGDPAARSGLAAAEKAQIFQVTIGVDSSVLLGILKRKERYRSWLEFILDVHRQAQLVVCDVVYAEIAGVYRREAELQEALASLGLGYDAIRSDTASWPDKSTPPIGVPEGRGTTSFLIFWLVRTPSSRRMVS